MRVRRVRRRARGRLRYRLRRPGRTRSGHPRRLDAVGGPRAGLGAERTDRVPVRRLTAAETELRLGAAGDAAQFASCVAAARGRCTHPAMAAWLPRLDALEARAAEVF
jgi:hypothetical protein